MSALATAGYLVCLLTLNPVEQVLFLSVVLHNLAVYLCLRGGFDSNDYVLLNDCFELK